VFASASAGAATRHAAPAPKLHAQRVCADVAAGLAHCMSFVMATADGRPFASPTVSGYGPTDLQDAYKLPSSTNGGGMTVGIVDAFDNPNAEADLQVYRSNFGLPTCTTANGCFKKVDQRGGTNYPVGNVGWGEEIALDLDMVSAICPKCHIVLVEANDNHMRALGKSVNQAVAQGADAVSNSWGGREKGIEKQWDELYFNHPGIAVTASSGDSGYGTSYPAGSQYVTAVGGTALTRDGSQRGWHETVWSGAGSGCSTRDHKPAWQTDTGCKMRTIADVSAVASPSTGVAVYDTYGAGGWLVFGGTSVSSPIIASVYALAGANVQYGSRVYMNPGKLFDVTSGSNGSCGGSYLCTGMVGYDGPTGLGTPNGIGDF
jgi:subtilase family serine protease